MELKWTLLMGLFLPSCSVGNYDLVVLIKKKNSLTVMNILMIFTTLEGIRVSVIVVFTFIMTRFLPHSTLPSVCFTDLDDWEFFQKYPDNEFSGSGDFEIESSAGSVAEYEDIDECEDPDVCGINAECHNHPGGYSCICHQGYSNYGNNQSKCIKMNCDQFKPEPDAEHTPKKLKHLMSLLKNSCETLNDPQEEHFTGKMLLENLFNSTDDLLSDGNIASGKMLSQFLDAVENSMRLIGPQLKEPVTRMETHNTVAEVAVTRSQTPPTGSVTLSTDSALFNTSWETVVGKSYPGFAFVALVSFKNLNSSSDQFHKISRERSDDKERKITYQLNSKVVTVVVSNPDTKRLSEPVTLIFTHMEERTESGSADYSCVFWNETEGAWSGQGCEKAWSNGTHTSCSYSHLSSFALLMALYPVQDTSELVLITRVGLVLSLVCLFLCILTFRFCRSIQGTRNSIHLHLSVCLFIADLVFLCGISSTHNRIACAIVAGLLHYFFLSAFCWMLLEGVQLYRMVVLVFHTTIKHLYMYAVGYGVPLVIVTVSAITYPQGYGTDQHCWLSLDGYFILSFFIPVCIVIILNCFVFIITVWKLAKKFSNLNPDLSKLKQIRSFTVTAVAQLCVLGGTWVFGFFLFQKKGTEVMLYLFTIFNSLQGALIFIMHCLLSKTATKGEIYKMSCSCSSCVACSVRKGLIFLMLCIANLHDCAILAMWSLKVSWSSKITPRFLIELEGIIVDELS
ncbi:adhesion G protein-coupled receptor E5-like isoform X2 [Megalobrama amblycephala]|uniref:adhesion G protein-coupled receptor E5-like isoform X2 n=1 Tax=Megalobrama amblycephala TaxID=75352 RepID=UPI002013E970|nr:adhesion G protein-coupled receptor E5-like isoform X2 [Megalobrama amblycephala]